jgi:hypothetical protein
MSYRIIGLRQSLQHGLELKGMLVIAQGRGMQGYFSKNPTIRNANWHAQSHPKLVEIKTESGTYSFFIRWKTLLTTKDNISS